MYFSHFKLLFQKCLAKFKSNLCIRRVNNKNRLNSPVLISEKNHLFEIENAQIYDYLFIVLCSLRYTISIGYSFLEKYYFRKVILFPYKKWANDYVKLNTTYVYYTND